MAAGSLGCQELWRKQRWASGSGRHATSKVAGTCCALVALYLLLDCMGRLSCVAGATPDIMGFIVLAAGLRIPGLLEVLALGPALDAKKSESDAEATEDQTTDSAKLPGSSLALLAASSAIPVSLKVKGQAVESFEYLAILLGAQIVHLVVLLWRNPNLCPEMGDELETTWL
ncbi:unnamed protein product [Symbiodinium sp. CCMP2592]|nr:unnamed protein product [Symbiodinium sp. CCMP2592]